jgi:hypothetical protein
MDSFRDTAFYLMVWQTFLAILATLLLIALNDIEPAIALLIAANLALLFALVLMIRANRLDEQRIVRTAFWRTIPARQRPRGEAGLRLARVALAETWLRFAKAAAAAAIVLCALAYASHGMGAAYGARLVPMN